MYGKQAKKTIYLILASRVFKELEEDSIAVVTSISRSFSASGIENRRKLLLAVMHNSEK